MEALVFKTTLKETPINIDNKDYVLRELNGAGMSKWRGLLGGKITVGSDSKVMLSDIDTKDQEVNLLSLCLYDVTTDKQVPITVLNTWPTHVLAELFNAAKELSGLTEQSRKALETAAKNS